MAGDGGVMTDLRLTDEEIAFIRARRGNGHLPPLPPAQPGKVIVVVSPKGGSGKTAVSSNVAVTLAQQFPGRVVALDLDVQFGDLCVSMGLRPEHNLAEVAASAQIDATMI